MLLHALHCLYCLHESLSTTKYGLKKSKLCSTNVYKRHKSMQILSFRPHSSNSEQTLRLMKQSSPRPQCPKWAWIGPQKSEGKATQIPGFTGRAERVGRCFWNFGMILWHLASWHGLLSISSVRNTKHMMSLTVHLAALAANAPHLKRIWEGCPYGTRVRGLTAPQLNVRNLNEHLLQGNTNFTMANTRNDTDHGSPPLLPGLMGAVLW